VIPPGAITLGVLAGGRSKRMGGLDKTWIEVDGQPMLAGCVAQFPQTFAARMVSARALDPRHDALGLRAVLDLRDGFPGPVAGLEALARACTTRWLLTVPVDARGISPDVVDALAVAATGDGACLVDAGGLQPLLALWRAEALAAAAATALDAGDAAARALVEALALARVDLSPLRLRNLNTPASLQETDR
jgi:molybdopterin-guanine dinucleotide biosynthesis protein A